MSTLDIIFNGLVFICILQRLAEFAYSKSNQILLEKQGFSVREPIQERLKYMAFETSWFLAATLEWYLGFIPIPDWLRFAALLIFIASQSIRIWAIKSMGVHWSVDICAPNKIDTPSMGELTEDAMISGLSEDVEKAMKENLFSLAGPFQYVRHPYYLAKILEIAALPMVGGSILTAALFSFLYNHLLNERIEFEESWLFSRPGYHEMFYHKSRFFPF